MPESSRDYRLIDYRLIWRMDHRHHFTCELAAPFTRELDDPHLKAFSTYAQRPQEEQNQKNGTATSLHFPVAVLI